MGRKKSEDGLLLINELLREINLTEDQYLHFGTLWREFGNVFKTKLVTNLTSFSSGW